MLGCGARCRGADEGRQKFGHRMGESDLRARRSPPGERKYIIFEAKLSTDRSFSVKIQTIGELHEDLEGANGYGQRIFPSFSNFFVNPNFSCSFLVDLPVPRFSRPFPRLVIRVRV